MNSNMDKIVSDSAAKISAASAKLSAESAKVAAKAKMDQEKAICI